MKVIFEVKDTQDINNHFEKIAIYYQTSVLNQDIGDEKFIFVKSRIKIVEKSKDNKKFVYVWGANNEDIEHLKIYFGDPVQKLVEKMTPVVFATELAEIQNVDDLTKEDLITLLDVTERDLKQYARMLGSAARRSSATEEIIKASQILQKVL